MRTQQRRYGLEQLETRAMLDGHGVLWGVDAGLSLSFVPDGTHVGPEQSQLFDLFSQLGPPEAWQDAILRGFQTWARQTNADIGVVDDDGSRLGIDGATSGDPRFGDIRIAAIPMASDYFATSIPTDELVDGTWVGDVFFNSNVAIENLDDLFAVALHEAGHVFGVKHSTDPMSPLFRHDVPESTVPTAADIDALQQNFGKRRPDSYESKGEGSEIELDGDGQSSTPGIVYGDISSASDVDVFKVEMPDGDDNGSSMSIRLVTEGVSLLRARLRVETESGSVLGEASYGEETQLVTLTSVDIIDEEIIVRVSADGAAPFDVGAYSIVATYDDSNVVPENIIDEIATSRVRSIEQDDIQRFFQLSSSFEDDDDHVLLDDDMGSDDDEGDEVELEEDDAFPNATRFVTMNALSSATDIDRFQVQIPAGHERGAITVALSSLTDGFRTSVRVRDDSGNAVETEQLVNGHSTAISQIYDVSAGDILTFEIGRSVDSQVQLGNYELLVRFNQDPVSPNVVTTSSIDASGKTEHRLRVNRTQLVQFGIDPLGDGFLGDTSVTAQVIDDSGVLVSEFISNAGELATTSVLLLPGDYTIIVISERELSYRLLANSVDEPLGPEPVDPTENPFCGYHFVGLFQCIILIGDVNNDGFVDFEDFLNLANNFGKTDAARSEGDLNGDLTVNFSDFLILAANFGQQNEELIT